MTRNARRLRRDMTEAEKRLWKHLRNRQMEGCKFRRQEPVQNRIADFLCIEVKLIIELDGGQHGEQIEADAERTRQLEAAGYTVLRFWSSDVLANTDGMLHEIRRTLLIAKGE
ncbi:MAG: endonuclease domain-containing protein [Sphingomonadales bacterium]|nr:endonuclease domain-containing protein [Sphingomonadales bacterium]MBK9005087.1 endonuclease domain-containing protein [Sphingomonadales bacterium]MBK9267180.1 endonuclease domain-containing protein [Sphingomonadales bacterium]